MTGIKSSLHLIHARLENLERQNRRLKQGMILLMSLGGALCFMGQSPAVEKSISAERIMAVRPDGGERAVLMATSLSLLDKNGIPRAMLSHDESGSAISFHDEQRNAVGLIRVDDLGPQLSFYDRNGRVRVVLDLHGEESLLTFFDESERGRVALGLDANQAGLLIRDATEQNRAYLGYDATGTHLSLSDEGGQEVYTKP
ncbi:MAG TPA: hypothetical protein PK878_07805 [bacterium]|nr:hypothetical protein [Candidatus Omnitrophota bacterium]HOJ60179.1 hypothetical protein [bacterium]HPP03138.1 hypothetical protein [bacterium]